MTTLINVFVMEVCGLIYVVCRKLSRRGPISEKYCDGKGRNSKNIETLSTFFAVANSRNIVSGAVPKKKGRGVQRVNVMENGKFLTPYS